MPTNEAHRTVLRTLRLFRASGAHINSIATVARMSAGAAAQCISELVASGQIERVVDPAVIVGASSSHPVFRVSVAQRELPRDA